MEQKPAPIDKEVMWDKTATLMSKTDKHGTIEYANEAFIDVSGYEDYELMGQPHNIIRHPDMPKVVFKVLWDSLKKGENFNAIVKNLSKTGRYYWVITDFEVTKDNKGEILKYVGKRRAVPQDVITKIIEPLYTRLLQIEKASGLEASEKYLTGFLEEQGKTYDQFIVDAFVKFDENKVEVKEEAKGFFGKFFGR